MGMDFSRNVRRSGFLLILLLSCVIVGCSASSGEGLDISGRPLSEGGNLPLAPTLASVQANVFNPSCIVCHSGANAPQGRADGSVLGAAHDVGSNRPIEAAGGNEVGDDSGTHDHHAHHHQAQHDLGRGEHLQCLDWGSSSFLNLAAAFAELAKDSGDSKGDSAEDTEEANEHEGWNQMAKGLQVINVCSVSSGLGDGQDESDSPAHEGHGEHGEPELSTYSLGQVVAKSSFAGDDLKAVNSGCSTGSLCCIDPSSCGGGCGCSHDHLPLSSSLVRCNTTLRRRFG